MLARKKWPSNAPQKNQSRCKGFTLIEVLIAIVVLCVGMLGVAAIQIRSLQYNHDAYLRSQINTLSTDIAESIRLNRSNATGYLGNYTIPTSAPTGCVTASGADTANDLACWRLRVFNALPPGGSANISGNAGLYTVTLSWTDRKSDTRSVSYTFLP